MKYRAETGATPSHYWRRVLVAGAVVLGLAGVGYGGYQLMTESSPHTPAPSHQPTVAGTTLQPKPEPLESDMLFVGDVFWGRKVQTDAEASPLKYKYPTSGLDKSAWDTYDGHIGNFECPITNRDVPYSEQVATLTFNCHPQYLGNLASWFTAGGQANNHTMNNGGQWGIQQTRQNLQQAGIQYFGNYDMTKTDDICEVIDMPAHLAGSGKKTDLPVALCGYMYVVDSTPTDAQLAVMRKYAKVMPVIAMPHMGVEYRSTAEPEKVSAYHRMIDNGADAVIAAHPHVIQNSENYHGRLIAYSLGNFLFDQQSLGRNTTLGLGVGLDLTIKDPQAAKVYEQVAPSCKAYKDDCVATLRSKLKRRPAIDVSYHFRCYDESYANHSVPTPVPLKNCAAAATLDRLQGLSSTW